MKIRYLGTGAAEGVPGIFCNCETCKEVRRRGKSEYHTRSQVLIDGKLSIEFPPDSYYHAIEFGVDLAAVEHVVVTHSHCDHFYAHDFVLRGYKYAAGLDKKLFIYGNAEVEKVFLECTAREMREEVANNISFVRLQAFEEVSFDGYTVLPIPAKHVKTEDAFVFLIEKDGKKYLHLTDTGELSFDTLKTLFDCIKTPKKAVDLVAFDCTFLFRKADENARHMGLENNKIMLEKMREIGLADGQTKAVITHYSHNGNPLSENLKRAENEYAFTAAYDGLEIKL
jgi:phosphoribosyl 1,2-cyclic phosphate phosphodiesterase